MFGMTVECAGLEDIPFACLIFPRIYDNLQLNIILQKIVPYHHLYV